MPRVLRIINRLNLGGPTFNVAYLTKYLSPAFETRLVSGLKDQTEESSEFILNDLNIKPLYLKNMQREISPVHDFSSYKEVLQIIEEYKPDIVHTHAAKAGTIGRLAAHHAGVKAIVHTFHGHVFHSYFSPLKTNLFIQIERYLAKKSHAIVAISEKQKSELSEVYKICPKDKIHTIPLGFDLNKFRENQLEKRNRFRKEYLIEDDEIVVSIIGRLVPIKNHALFIQSIHSIKDRLTRKVRFMIVGDGESRNDIIDQIKALGLDYTFFPEQQKKALVTLCSWRKDIDAVNAGSDIITLCSFNEGTPVSLIEAQAANKPILSTRVGGIEDITDPSTAVLTQSNDLTAFSGELLKLIEDQELRSKLSAKGWELVGERFHYTRLAKDMENLYNSLLS